MGISYKCNHRICGPLCLVLSLTIMLSRFILGVARVRAPVLFIARYYSVVCKYRILFIHPPAEGPFSSFSQLPHTLSRGVLNLLTLTPSGRDMSCFQLSTVIKSGEVGGTF